MEVAAIVVLCVLAWRVFAYRRAVRRKAQFDLRFPILSTGGTGELHVEQSADFERMQLIIVSIDRDSHQTQVYRLRRREGPAWEISEETESQRRSLEHLRAERALWHEPFFSSSEETFRRRELEAAASQEWRSFEGPTVEVHYQRFVARYASFDQFENTPLDFYLSQDYPPGGARPARPARRAAG